MQMFQPLTLLQPQSQSMCSLRHRRRRGAQEAPWWLWTPHRCARRLLPWPATTSAWVSMPEDARDGCTAEGSGHRAGPGRVAAGQPGLPLAYQCLHRPSPPLPPSSCFPQAR